MRPASLFPMFVSSLFGAACAGPSTSVQPARPGGEPVERAQPVDTLAVSGLRGTLSQREIEGALDPKLPKFLACVERGRAAIEALAGSLSLSFHVAVDGAVAAVQPSHSSLGDREVERCILALAETIRFPAPHGGEADFTWPLELPIDPELRPPVELDAPFARVAIEAKGASLLVACGGSGQVAVTAYVDPDGRVLAAGVATPDPTTSARLDCIAAGVRDWTFSSPGSYLGKVSFALP